MSRTSSTRRALRPAVAFGFVLALLLAACGSSDNLDGKVVSDGAPCHPTAVERKSPAPTITPVKKEPKELSTKDLTKGTGCPITKKPYVTLDLVGATAVSGKQFADTFKPKRPITAKLGQGTFVTGLENGLDGMQVGGRRQITVPADQAYGKDGDTKTGIGPDQGLIFIVDLVAVSDEPLYCAEPQLTPTDASPDKPETIAVPDKPIEGDVKVTVLKPGDGPKVEDTSYVEVKYVGVACSTGKEFDASYDRGDTFIAAMPGTNDDQHMVIQGWSKGLIGQQQGARVQLDIPADLAYGDQGSGADIGPNEALSFVVDIVKVYDKSPYPSTTTSAVPETTAAPSTTAKP